MDRVQSNASDYVRDLIWRNQEVRALHDEVQTYITAGMRSGIGSRSMKLLLEHARAATNTLNSGIKKHVSSKMMLAVSTRRA